MMKEILKQKVIINNLLSFLIYKLKLVSKDKLLKCISNFYSKLDISEAQKILFASLPIEVSDKYTKKGKYSDPLTLIYDCIQGADKDLPVFVCKDLNDIPFLDTSHSTNRKESNVQPSKENFNYFEDEEKEMDDDEYRKEQKEMKTQISQMMCIISELKVGLQKFNRNQKSAAIIKEEANNDETQMTCIKEKDESSYEGNSHLAGLALIQKLIDEDYENNKLNPMAEDDCSSNSSDIEANVNGNRNYNEVNDISNKRKKRRGNILKRKKLSREICRTNLTPQTTVIFADTSITSDEKIISINEDDTLMLKNGQAPSFRPDEDTLDISETCIPHIEISISPKISSDVGNENELDSDFSTAQEDKYDFRACAPERCPVCNVTFSSKLDYDQHTKAHYTKGTYDCSLCNKGFTSRDNLVEHFVSCFRELKDHCNLDGYTCISCGSFYADQTSLIRHKSFHSECRPFPCSYCSYRYFSGDSLKLHIRNQHNPMNKYQCPLCDLSFLCNSFLLAHIAVHTGCRPFRCKVCDHKADTKKAIKQHIHTHGDNQPQKFKCKECSYICNGKYILLKHRLVKHREPVRCSLCEKTFKNPSAYKRHYDIHRSKSNLKCQICLYSTPFKRYLDKHMLTHPATTKFQCPKCGIPLSNKHTIGHHLHSYCKSSLKEQNE